MVGIGLELLRELLPVTDGPPVITPAGCLGRELAGDDELTLGIVGRFGHSDLQSACEYSAAAFGVIKQDLVAPLSGLLAIRVVRESLVEWVEIILQRGLPVGLSRRGHQRLGLPVEVLSARRINPVDNKSADQGEGEDQEPGLEGTAGEPGEPRSGSRGV